MARLARLSVDFVARTAGFTKGLDVASKKAATFGDKVKRGFGMAQAGFAKVTAAAAPVAAAFTAVTAGIAAGVATVVSISKKLVETLRSIDDIADAAGRLGDTTANVVALGHAFELTGGNVEGAQKALEFMNKSIGKAIANGGASEKVFTRLGLSAESLARMAPTEALKAISDRLAMLPTNAERAAAAQAIFGKSAADSMSSLTAGSATINKFMADARALGLTISEVEAAEVGAAVDAIHRLEVAASGAFRQVAVAWAPAIEGAAHFATQAFQTWAAFTKSGQGAVRDVGSGFQVMFAEWEHGLKTWETSLEVFVLRVKLNFEILVNDLIHTLMQIPKAIQIVTNPLASLMGNSTEVATREITNQEKAMAAMIAQHETQLASGLEKLIAERLKGPELKDAATGLGAGFGEGAATTFADGIGAEIFDQPLADLKPPTDPIFQEMDDFGIGDMNPEMLKKIDKAIATPDTPGAIVRGSAEAFSAAARHQQGPLQTSLNKQTTLLQKLLDVQKDALNALGGDDDLELVFG